MRRLLITALLLALHFQLFLFAGDVKKEADLPKVLIIGDSISIGYTPHVVQLLKGDAIVKHHKGNAQHTGLGLEEIDLWIGETKWDVIHFNWGLWDLCYRHPKSKVQGRRDKVNGTITTSIELYEDNLDKLVTRLKRTDAKLIWAHTTVVPEEEAGRFVGDDKKYNAAAARVMQKHGIAIDDLYSLTADFSPDLFKGPGDVHYTNDGYEKIAKQVADEILSIEKAEQDEKAD
ncbi:MAG: SGNH/GDSL hydrolase family protein [Akkermansiaceae bacterium]